MTREEIIQSISEAEQIRDEIGELYSSKISLWFDNGQVENKPLEEEMTKLFTEWEKAQSKVNSAKRALRSLDNENR